MKTKTDSSDEYVLEEMDYDPETTSKKKKKSKKVSAKGISVITAKVIFRLLIAGVLIIGCAVVGLLLGVVVGCILTTEPVEYERNYEATDYVSYIYDASGNEIGTLKGSSSITNGEWTGIESIPENLQHAFVAIEDERFYEHDGVDLKRTLSAIAGFVVPGMSDHGGSTITQQLVKNLTGEDERSIPRKVREQWRALQLERDLSKNEIMELYLNIIYFANSAYGVQDASQKYFGKDVSELSLAECAFLAGITNSPGKYNPATMPGRTNAYSRQITILDAMYAQGWISKNEYIDAIQTELVFVSEEDDSSSVPDSGSASDPGNTENNGNNGNSGNNSSDNNNPFGSSSSIYSYFMDMVISDVRSDLMELGYSKKEANNIIYNSGTKIYTTQDPTIQAIVDSEYCNIENFPVNTSDSGDPDNAQSAIVIMDQTTGYVIAVYGGYGEKRESLTWNRAVSAARQPGSSIKPVLVYGPLVDQGIINAATAMDEEPSYLDNRNPDKLWPTNSDHKYHGLVPVRTAINRSFNVFAVTLYKNNVTSCLAYMKSVGIDRTDETHLSMALGGFTNGVSPRQMAAAYVPMANGGTYFEPITYTKLIDKNGNVIIDKSVEKGTKVFTKDTTSTVMTSLLTTVVSDSRGTGSSAQLTDKNGKYMPTAGKTGTTTDAKDYWFVGYTPYYTCAVWYGYDNHTAITSAESGAARKIWKKVMQRIHDNLEAKEFEIYGETETVSICSVSGKKSTSTCWNDPRCERQIYEETFAKGTAPTDYCNIHVTKNVCTAGTDKYGKYYLAGPKCTATKSMTGTYRPSIPDYLASLDKSNYPEDWSYELSHSTCPHCG